MNGGSNFCWFFFRNELASKISDRLNTHIKKWFQNILPQLNPPVPPSTYVQYSKIYPDPLCEEHGIRIQKHVENYLYAVPIFRIFLGQNNILIILHIPSSIDFPYIGDVLSHADLISKLHISFVDLFTKEWTWQKFTHYLDFIGTHQCRLNCGGCCDGDDYTRSPLLGGQYCRGLSTVGNLCLYRLFDPPLSLENRICGEYRCGQLQNPEYEASSSYNTGIFSFTPRYDSADMAEFFDQIQRISGKGDSETILEMTVRAQEIRHYKGIVEVIQNLIEPIRDQLPQFTNAFVFALARNQIENCEELLNQNRERLGNQYSSLQLALAGFRAWYNRYSYRRKHQALSIYPKSSFELNIT